MIQTVEAVVDATGCVRLLGEVHVTSPRRALYFTRSEMRRYRSDNLFPLVESRSGAVADLREAPGFR